MDLNKKSGTIQLFTTKIEENVFWDIQNFIVLKYFQPAKKYFDRIDGTWLIHVIWSEIFDYNFLTFWSKLKIWIPSF